MRTGIAASAAAVVLAAGCGGGGGGGAKQTRTKTVSQTGLSHRKVVLPSGPSKNPAADYSKALKAMRTGDYDTAIALMSNLGSYRDARRQVARIKVVGARHKLQVARRKLRTAPSPQSAVALTKTSIKYHSTPEARKFLRHAQAVHDRFKRRQAKGLTPKER